MSTYLFSQSFTVNNEQQLYDAAKQRAIDEGADIEDLMIDGEIDEAACIAMLMDPGYLPGCSSGNHEMEYINDR